MKRMIIILTAVLAATAALAASAQAGTTVFPIPNTGCTTTLWSDADPTPHWVDFGAYTQCPRNEQHIQLTVWLTYSNGTTVPYSRRTVNSYGKSTDSLAIAIDTGGTGLVTPHQYTVVWQ